MQLVQTQMVIAKHISYTFMKREGIPHLVHVERCIDFKKTPVDSQDRFIDTLIREMYLGNVFIRLLESHDFHVHSTYVVKNVIFRDSRQSPSLLRVFRRDIGRTPTVPLLLNTFSIRNFLKMILKVFSRVKEYMT